MKNVYILPTDKEGILIYNKKENRLIESHIYITSNDNIEEGFWVIYDQKYVKKADITFNKPGMSWHVLNTNKIIFTTDPNLIADSVQSLDNEFLEWILKNPNCEEVEVVEDIKYFNMDELRERYVKGLPYLYSEKISYKIIIPKEEPKQESFNSKRGLKEVQLKDPSNCEYYKEVGCIKHICTCYTLIPKESKEQTVEEYEKQETLEEASWRYYPLKKLDGEFLRGAFTTGAKSEAARDYWYSKWEKEQNNTSKVRRVEVIQHSPPFNGRAYTNYNAKDVEIQLQDDYKTLKIFLK